MAAFSAQIGLPSVEVVQQFAPFSTPIAGPFGDSVHRATKARTAVTTPI
ncbi:hypothetical protein [Paraburkholderia sp. J10-1]|nr:hypothetical protein [Paraburkholderia sp. J10-1]